MINNKIKKTNNYKGLSQLLGEQKDLESLVLFDSKFSLIDNLDIENEDNIFQEQDFHFDYYIFIDKLKKIFQNKSKAKLLLIRKRKKYFIDLENGLWEFSKKNRIKIKE